MSFTGSSGQRITINVGLVSATPSSPCYRVTTLYPDGTTVLRGELSADQLCKGAPWIIRAADLDRSDVKGAATASYLDQARLRRDEALAEARRLSPFNLAYALCQAWYGD